jgi:hypothetical protein
MHFVSSCFDTSVAGQYAKRPVSDGNYRTLWRKRGIKMLNGHTDLIKQFGFTPPQYIVHSAQSPPQILDRTWGFWVLSLTINISKLWKKMWYLQTIIALFCSSLCRFSTTNYCKMIQLVKWRLETTKRGESRPVSMNWKLGRNWQTCTALKTWKQPCKTF